MTTHAQPAHSPVADHTASGSQRHVEHEHDESLSLLKSVAIGRIGFTRDNLPTIRRAYHLLDDGLIVVRTRGDDALATQTAQSTTGIVVAYEADTVDPITHCGWSIVVTGHAHQVTDPEQLARYQRKLAPGSAPATSALVQIRPEAITRFRLS